MYYSKISLSLIAVGLVLFPFVTASADVESPLVTLRYSETIETDGTWKLGVKSRDDFGVESTVVYYKRNTENSFKRVVYSADEGYQWRSHYVGFRDTTVLFYIQSTDSSGNVTSRGTAKRPLQNNVSEPAERSAQSANLAYQGREVELDYGDNCEKTSLFKRASIVTKLGTETTESNGQQIPVGLVPNMSLSGGTHYIYSKWTNLKKRKHYEFTTMLVDSNGRIAKRGKNGFTAKKGGRRSGWTTWVDYTPKRKDPTGTWTFVLCEGGKRQVEMKIIVVK